MKKLIHYTAAIVVTTSFLLLIACKNGTVDMHFTSKEYALTNKLDFQYVQVVSGLDKSIQDDVNETLYISATEWLMDTYAWIADCRWDIVFQSDQYLTICYFLDMESGQFRIYNTVDLSNGKRIYLNDLIESEDQFVVLVQGAFPEIKTEHLQKLYYGASLSEDDYFSQLEKDFDPLVRQFPFSYLLNKPDFYLVDGGVGIKYSEYSDDDIFIIDGVVSGNLRAG